MTDVRFSQSASSSLNRQLAGWGVGEIPLGPPFVKGGWVLTEISGREY